MLNSASTHICHSKFSLVSVVYKIDQLSAAYTFSAVLTHCYTVDMTPEISHQRSLIHPAVCQTTRDLSSRLTGTKGYYSVEAGSRYHFIIGLVIDSEDKTVQMQITEGHHHQALAPLHQYVLDALEFEKGRGPIFNCEILMLSLSTSSSCD